MPQCPTLRKELLKDIDAVLVRHADQCSICKKLREIREEEDKIRIDKHGGHRSHARQKNVDKVKLLINVLQ